MPTKTRAAAAKNRAAQSTQKSVLTAFQRLATEDLITLRDAAKLVPGPKRVHYSTCFRWATDGLRGNKLDTVLIAGVRYTTEQELTRFLNTVTG